ncbi:MAG: hypothetical protein AAFY88_23495, partial [Acidobacteriota bacterium]
IVGRDPEQNRWTHRHVEVPVEKRSRFFLGLLGSSMLLLPGAAAAQGLTGFWSDLTPYPVPITNNAVTSVCDQAGCTLYSFMGMTDPLDSSSVTAAAFKLESPGTGAWQPIADAPLLSNRGKIAASAVTVAGEVYLIGGYTATVPELTEPGLFRYDPVDDLYVELAEVPTEVDDTVAGVYRDRYIYLISGWHGPINGNVRNVQVYDTLTDTWTQATEIPAAGRFGSAGGVIGDRLIFIDGSNFSISHRTLVGTIDADDPAVITWTQPAASPFSPTYRAANAQSDLGCMRMLFIGGTSNPYNFSGNGYNGQPSLPLDQVMAYDPVEDVWTAVDDSGGSSHTPTMDHRGASFFDGRWVIVGGMTGPGAAISTVSALDVPQLCEALPFFEDGFESGDTSAWSGSAP